MRKLYALIIGILIVASVFSAGCINSEKKDDRSQANQVNSSDVKNSIQNQETNTTNEQNQETNTNQEQSYGNIEFVNDISPPDWRYAVMPTKGEFNITNTKVSFKLDSKIPDKIILDIEFDANGASGGEIFSIVIDKTYKLYRSYDVITRFPGRAIDYISRANMSVEEFQDAYNKLYNDVKGELHLVYIVNPFKIESHHVVLENVPAFASFGPTERYAKELFDKIPEIPVAGSHTTIYIFSYSDGIWKLEAKLEFNY